MAQAAAQEPCLMQFGQGRAISDSHLGSGEVNDLSLRSDPVKAFSMVLFLGKMPLIWALYFA